MNSLDDFTTKFIWFVIGFMILIVYLKNREDDDFGEWNSLW